MDCIKYHGRHSTLDLVGFFPENSKEGGEFIFQIMRDSLKLGTCREVHSKLVILGLQGESPPGFTSVVLIDESHITSHCYSDRGWLAIDVFTCGSNSNPQQMIQFIYEKIKEKYPSVMSAQSNQIERFPLV